MTTSSITRVYYSTNKSPKSLMGKLEVVALFVGINGLHYESIDGEYWLLETGDGNTYQGELDDVIKRAYMGLFSSNT